MIKYIKTSNGVNKASYDLLLEIFGFTKDFGKEFKYTVGEKLKNETIELFTLIYRANSQKDKQNTLQEAREHIEAGLLYFYWLYTMQNANVY